jgi:hypothetical protein
MHRGMGVYREATERTDSQSQEARKLLVVSN